MLIVSTYDSHSALNWIELGPLQDQTRARGDGTIDKRCRHFVNYWGNGTPPMATIVGGSSTNMPKSQKFNYFSSTFEAFGAINNLFKLDWWSILEFAKC